MLVIAMTDGIDIADVDELKAELDRMNGNINGLANKINDLSDRLDTVESRIDKVENDVTVTKASVPDQSKNKLDNVMSVVEYAYDKKNGGRAGVKIKSGEITAVIDGSKQTGLRILDEIGGKFQWATAEKPGGPNENYLKVRIDKPLQQRKQEVADRYSA